MVLLLSLTFVLTAVLCIVMLIPFAAARFDQLCVSRDTEQRVWMARARAGGSGLVINQATGRPEQSTSYQGCVDRADKVAGVPDYVLKASVGLHLLWCGILAGSLAAAIMFICIQSGIIKAGI